ncbi:hypothetical protein EDB89DRAFT_1902052 [Lactarius sanguifluus]|nr:hypothetical protein EDB89DRAFT_1912948 [Lactarius sanguifluus]KAH9163163.1 hypothetical protein EDB89DRAFT_1912871 [Lactarius sanguifluus]KAH9170137.1 hypothetical protein EDB89DRAFT_1908009 [Lactarius sanguifluus]KAH9171772.1 hypothetical protein EDB89DRAFT_1906755 [Lactarius sanguifluus]KAH9174843.1 hypothetical protein EDB89DRAFT_1904395 [Lactarius sanguifluus]
MPASKGGDRVETAPVWVEVRGAGGKSRSEVEVAVAAVSRRRRRGGVEVCHGNVEVTVAGSGLRGSMCRRECGGVEAAAKSLRSQEREVLPVRTPRDGDNGMACVHMHDQQVEGWEQ